MEWLTFRYRIGGELYYNTVEAYARGQDPWRDQLLFGGNGDGTLFYPGRARAIGGTTRHPRREHAAAADSRGARGLRVPAPVRQGRRRKRGRSAGGDASPARRIVGARRRSACTPRATRWPRRSIARLRRTAESALLLAECCAARSRLAPACSPAARRRSRDCASCRRTRRRPRGRSSSTIARAAPRSGSTAGRASTPAIACARRCAASCAGCFPAGTPSSCAPPARCCDARCSSARRGATSWRSCACATKTKPRPRPRPAPTASSSSVAIGSRSSTPRTRRACARSSVGDAGAVEWAERRRRRRRRDPAGAARALPEARAHRLAARSARAATKRARCSSTATRSSTADAFDALRERRRRRVF